VVAAAGLAVGVVLVAAKQPGDAAAPAVAIGAAVAFAELATYRLRRRNTVLRRRLVGLVGTPPTPAARPEPHERLTRDSLPEPGPGEPDLGTRTSAMPLPARHLVGDDRRRQDAQCPRCGRFLVDVEPHEVNSFHCRACNAAWSCARDQPWPDITITPDLSRLRRREPTTP
jgi:hypothetical protein